MKPAVERVALALRQQGIEPRIVEFAQSTRTAEEAAHALNTEVARIVKSLLFLAGERPLLALVSGSNRVAPARLAAALDAPITRADAATVRAVTGFAIGGVPPLGHAVALPIVCDADLLRYDIVYAAAGTPNAVFPIAPPDLVRITQAQVVDLKEEDAGSPSTGEHKRG
ncbi:MAG TPA: YbaK/EbsC family protein [Chloroflexota bacterium]|nr:YbaK/EbsC family protein [Chloroflexota bacterium]